MHNPFRLPSAQDLAQKQLAEAERQLLDAQAQEEYARNAVRMLTERVQRLRDMTTQSVTLDVFQKAAATRRDGVAA